MDGKVGEEVFYHKLALQVSLRLPAYCSVFQAKCVAIKRERLLSTDGTQALYE